MDKIKNKNELAFISFLDEKNRTIEIFVELVHVDSSFVKFKTEGNNLVSIPSCRVLKIKEKLNWEEKEDGDVWGDR